MQINEYCRTFILWVLVANIFVDIVYSLAYDSNIDITLLVILSCIFYWVFDIGLISDLIYEIINAQNINEVITCIFAIICLRISFLMMFLWFLFPKKF